MDEDTTQPEETPTGSGLLDDLVPPETPPAEPAPEPVPETPETPETPAEPVTDEPEPTRVHVATATPQPDQWDAEYAEALKEIDVDDLKTPSEKRIAKLQLMELREQRYERRAATTQTAEERYRKQQAKQFGVEEEQVVSAWTDAIAEARKELGRDVGENDRSAIEILYRQKLKAAKAAPKPLAGQPAARPAPTRTITPGGGRVVPGTHRHTPPPPEKKSAADKVLEEVGPLSGWKI